MREAREQTQLRDDNDANMYNEEVYLIKNMKQDKKSDIEARVRDAFTYVKLYIKKDNGRTDIKALRSRYENFTIKSSTLARSSIQLRPPSIETKEK